MMHDDSKEYQQARARSKQLTDMMAFESTVITLMTEHGYSDMNASCLVQDWAPMVNTLHTTYGMTAREVVVELLLLTDNRRGIKGNE